MANTQNQPTTVKSAAPPAQTALPPSHIVNPTSSQTAPQQAATEPGDGGRVTDPGRSPTIQSGPVPWKEQVIAFAKKTRGAVLRKPTLKEHGDQILAGEASAWEPTRKP